MPTGITAVENLCKPTYSSDGSFGNSTSDELEGEKNELIRAMVESYSIRNEVIDKEILSLVKTGGLGCNVHACTLLLMILNQKLSSYHELFKKMCADAETKKKGSKVDNIKVRHIFIMISKIFYIDIMLYSAMISDQNQIFYIPNEDERWSRLR